MTEASMVPIDAAKPTAKVWGFTTPLVTTPLFELHYLQIKPEHRCSFHKHRHKHNVFFVIEGALFVDSDCNGVSNTQRIGAHEFYSVAPSCKHQFRTGHEGCYVLEMYYPEALGEDIVRYNVGGPVCEDRNDGELQN